MLGLVLVGLFAWPGVGLVAQVQSVDAEAARIAEVLRLAGGDVVADVGAGSGTYTAHLAEVVGSDGWVFATEVDAELLPKIRDRLAEGDARHTTIVLGTATHTGLPPACCDAVLLRRVYHHITEPTAMHESLWAALRPGGRLAIIDFEPTPGSTIPPGVPTDRRGHGMPRDLLVEEMTEAGFTVSAEYDSWPGRGGRDDYCVVFSKAASE